MVYLGIGNKTNFSKWIYITVISLSIVLLIGFVLKGSIEIILAIIAVVLGIIAVCITISIARTQDNQLKKSPSGDLTFDGVQNTYLISPVLGSYASP